MQDNLKIHLKVHMEHIHVENHQLIQMSNHLNGQHLIHTCSYHHAIQHLLYNMHQSQQLNCHTENCNTQHMSKTLSLMFTLEYSRKILMLMVKFWKLELSTYLVSFFKIIFMNGVRILFEAIQIAHKLKN